MLFVILSDGEIPGYGVRGPVLSPTQYDLHTVLKWIASGVDVRECMSDGSYRKLKFNDGAIMEALDRVEVIKAIENTPKIVYKKPEVKPVEVKKPKVEKTYPSLEEDGFLVDKLEDINQ